MSKLNEKLLVWFDDNFTVQNSYDDTFYYSYCPSCGKLRFFYNKANKTVKCWKCFDTQSIHTFAKFYGYELNLSDIEYREIKAANFTSKTSLILDREDILPKNAIPLANVPKNHKAIKYLATERKLPKFAFDYLKIYAYVTPETPHQHIDGHDYSGRILLPIYADDGHIVSFTGRTYCGDYVKHKVSSTFKKGKHLWNRDALFLSDTVYITEGIFDALFFAERGVALNGISFNDDLVRLLRACPATNLVFVADTGAHTYTTFSNYWRKIITSRFANTSKNLYLAVVGQEAKEDNLVVNFRSGKTDINEEFKKQGSLNFLKTSLRRAEKLKTRRDLITF